MANLEREGFREALPTLKATDLRGARFTVVTIASAKIVPGDKRKGSREKLLLLKFQEWPDRNYFPNSSGIGRLMKGVGAETETMPGKRIALVVTPTVNPDTKEEVDALHIAPTEEWDTLMEEYDGADGNDGKKKKRRAASRK